MPYTDYGDRRRAEDIALMRDPARWPYTVLPLKRYELDTKRMECGILLLDEPKVWLGNIYQRVTSAHQSITYSSFDALVADGWTVD